jgi:hypothetical protein
VKGTNIVLFEEGTEQGIQKVGWLTLKEGGLIDPTAADEPDPKLELRTNKQVLEEILGKPATTTDGKVIERKNDPVGWFKQLPYTYRGSYFWARFV